MNLRALLAKRPDANLLRRMIGCSGRRRLACEVGAPTGAAQGKKIAKRLAQRSGYRERDWRTRAARREAGDL